MEMKLYYAPGVCSLAPHIVAREAGIPIELEQVDIRTSPQRTESGSDFAEINSKGYVPVLRLDNGEVLTEGVAILQYLADLRAEAGLAPPAGTFERYRLQEWLTFISSELHKMFSPWLFHPEHGEQAATVARAKIAERLSLLDHHLDGRDYLLGERFTVADAYCFAIVDWTRLTRIDLAPWPNLATYTARIRERPKVREAMQAEGLGKAAA
jgi:glutathione S-transferase